MQKISLIISALCLIIVSVFFSLYLQNDHKVGYVDNAQLLIKYKGYLEAQDEYKVKEQNWQSNMDTMEQDLKMAFIAYQTKQPILTSDERIKEEQILNFRKNNFLKAKDKFQENMSLENERLMKVVSGQIESFINEYAINEHYDLIVGITEQGNVLYSNMNKNITEELLIGLNANYEGI